MLRIIKILCINVCNTFIFIFYGSKHTSMSILKIVVYFFFYLFNAISFQPEIIRLSYEKVWSFIIHFIYSKNPEPFVNSFFLLHLRRVQLQCISFSTLHNMGLCRFTVYIWSRSYCNKNACYRYEDFVAKSKCLTGMLCDILIREAYTY